MKETIYPQRSQVVEDIFSRENRLDKILIIPLDHAKESHTVQFRLATGVYLLKKALTVYNDQRGVDFLITQIEKICKKHHIKKQNVAICCEDPHSYMVNFIHAVRLRGYRFASVNATEASKYRSNTRASSDELDLTGISQAVINRRAMDVEPVDELYTNLKYATRSRVKLIRNQTSIKNRIHKCVDILFPGFLCESNTGLTPFSEGCLWLLENRFSVVKIKRMSPKYLLNGLKKHRVHNVPFVVDKVKSYAEKVLAPPAEIVAYQQKSLAGKVSLFRNIRAELHREENEAVRYLLQTPGFYILSIPGIATVYATNLIAEYGNPTKWRGADKMASYAGIASRQKQTGGEKRKTPTGQHLPRDCNRILKDYLLQAAQHTGTSLHPFRKISPSYDGSHTLQQHYQHVESIEGKSRLRNAKYLIKIIIKLVDEERFYFPEKHWLSPEFAPRNDDHILLYQNTIQRVKDKLKGYDISGIDPEKNYLYKEEQHLKDLIEFKNMNQ